jgi:hypothetical protein
MLLRQRRAGVEQGLARLQRAGCPGSLVHRAGV